MRTSALQQLRWVKPKDQQAVAAEPTLLDFAPTAYPARAAALRRAILEAGLPEPPQGEMSVVEEARYLMQAAAEVEHALLIQYLYAVYSIRTKNALNAARQRRRKLLNIALEEMGHLLTAQNLLLAVGASPYFDRGNTLLGGGPAGDHPFPLRLEPLSPDSLAKYVTAESPPLDMIQDPALRARVEPVFARAAQVAGQNVNHIGVLFAKIFWLFQPNDDPHPLWPELPGDLLPSGRHLAESDFVTASEPQQAQPEEFNQDPVDPPSGENIYIIPVRSRIESLFALDKIAEQGEGWQLGPESHFERFLEAYEKFDTELAGYIAPVPVNPHTSATGMAPGLITHPAALLWARLANARYQMLLLKLGLGLRQPRQPGDGGPLSRFSLFQSSLDHEMEALKVNGARLVEFSDQGEVAGLPFELPDDPLPTDNDGIKRRLGEVVLAARELIQQLINLPAPNAPTQNELDLLESLRQADESLLAALQP